MSMLSEDRQTNGIGQRLKRALERERWYEAFHDGSELLLHGGGGSKRMRGCQSKMESIG
jgi:hypothetical protein